MDACTGYPTSCFVSLGEVDAQEKTIVVKCVGKKWVKENVERDVRAAI